MRKLKVLVVDDDPAFQAKMMALLNGNGYTANATTSNEVLTRFFDLQPDIVLTELIMSEQEGLELIVKLRQFRPDLTIIAVTGSERATSYLKMAQLLGARATLRKPFPEEELLRVLAQSTAVELEIRSGTIQPEKL